MCWVNPSISAVERQDEVVGFYWLSIITHQRYIRKIEDLIHYFTGSHLVVGIFMKWGQ
tara:strand:+ start:198 stop:371 length:174 start_codon:yes stop_codon:yes gene_type:complete